MFNDTIKMANIDRNFIFAEESKVRGMLVPQRSEQSVMDSNSLKTPFISMVTVKDPLGLNPVHKPVIVYRKKKDNNEAYIRNKQLLNIIKEKGIKRRANEAVITSPICEPTPRLNKAKSLKYLKPIGHFKQNKEDLSLKPESKEILINQPITQRELITEDKKDNSPEVMIISNITNKESQEEEKKGRNLIKEDEKIKETLKEMNQTQEDPLLIEDKIDEDEMNKILGYINNLDYDKYARDLEIREALQLIKNKMEKDQEEKDAYQNQQAQINNPDRLNQIQNETNKDKEKEKEKEEDKDKDLSNKLPEIKTPIANKQEEEKKEEIKKLQLAEQISKCDPVNNQLIYLYITNRE